MRKYIMCDHYCSECGREIEHLEEYWIDAYGQPHCQDCIDKTYNEC